MADLTIKHVDEIEGIHGGTFKLIRRELEVSAFGINLGMFPANHASYPEHDHQEDGQEEVYIVLEGSGTITVDGEPHAVHKGHMARVGPSSKRKLTAGPTGIQVLTIGNTPGSDFVPNW